MDLAQLRKDKKLSTMIGISMIAVLLSLLNMSSAWAHAHVIKTSPEANSTVDTLTQVCVEFDNKLESAFSKLNLFNEEGQQVNLDEATFDKEDKEICLVVPELEPGTYKAEWMAVARDGHQVTGDYEFSVK